MSHSVSKSRTHQKYVFTLIHGTFARSASWTYPGSFFCSQINKKISGPDTTVHFFRHGWCGGNTQIARRESAENLAKHIKNVNKLYPDARHILVGHSHGGNVALYACADSEVERCISGIICLATPFYGFLRRNTRQIAIPLFLFILLAIIFLSIQLIDTYFFGWTIDQLLNLGPSWEVLVVLWALAVGIVIVLLRALSLFVIRLICRFLIFVDNILAYRDAIISSNSAPRLPNMRILCLWTPGDEVTSLFRTMLYLTNAPLFVWNWLFILSVFTIIFVAQLFEPALHVTLTSGVDFLQKFGITIPPAVAKAHDYLFIVYLRVFDAIIATSVIVGIMLTIASIVALISGTIAQRYLIGARTYGIGGSILVNIAHSLTPLTSASVEFYDIECSKGILAHSKIYDDEQATDRIASWLGVWGGERLP